MKFLESNHALVIRVFYLIGITLIGLGALVALIGLISAMGAPYYAFWTVLLAGVGTGFGIAFSGLLLVAIAQGLSCLRQNGKLLEKLQLHD